MKAKAESEVISDPRHEEDRKASQAAQCTHWNLAFWYVSDDPHRRRY